MKNRILVVAICVVVMIGVACAPPEEEAPGIPAEQAVSELVVGWDNAMRTGEVEGAVALFAAENPAIMPPDVPGQSGAEGLAAHFTTMFEDGGLEVTNREFGVFSSGDLVAAQGAYTLTLPLGGDEYRDETGKWICIAKRKEDGSLAIVRNIWNRDAPPPGAPAVPGFEGTGPAAAADAPCLQSPTEVDDAFVSNWIEGNVPVLAANHAERGSRMPPGRPSVDGRDRISAYLQSEVDRYSDRTLELMDRGEEVDGDLGYAWGRYRVAYKLADGSGSLDTDGKYVTVSRKGEDGCWRNQWVIWNGDSPWPKSR
jgi:ketosteroid isomerase-like protein